MQIGVKQAIVSDRSVYHSVIWQTGSQSGLRTSQTIGISSCLFTGQKSRWMFSSQLFMIFCSTSWWLKSHFK